MHRFVLVAAALALAPNAAAADCAPVDLAATVITKPDAAIPGDGGILVAATPGNYNPANRGKSSEVVRPTWRISLAGSRGGAVTDVLAPGLAVYRIPATPSPGRVELEDENQKVLVKVTTTKDKPAVYAAPKVKKLEYLATMSRRSWQRIEATLEAEPPEGTYAIVIADTKGNAKSWGPAGKGVTQFPYTHSDCGTVPNGTVVPKPGELVTVFFVDTLGRRSLASKPLKLGGKPNPY
jgi:hypothetical protein